MNASKPLSAREREELSAFLERYGPPDGIRSISAFDGLACALAVAPKMILPSVWLRSVFRGVASLEEMQAMLGLVMRHYNDVVDRIANDSYEPLLPKRSPPNAGHRAQPWAIAFILGMSFDETWLSLGADERNSMMIMPIMILADAESFIASEAPDGGSMESFIGMLPHVVPIIRAHWQKPRASRKAKTVAATTSPAKRPQTVHRLKIQLLGVKPAIWRLIEIESDAKLPAVSRALLMAMGWTDTHLHSFRVGRETFAVPDPDFPSDDLDERRVTLVAILPAVGDSLRYDYDFGDGWQHRVTVEAIEPEDPVRKHPRCIAGKRACPPEDCGGPDGYARLLEAIENPKDDEESEHLRRWAGPFDPSAFDLIDTNLGLDSLTIRRRGSRSTLR